MYKYKRYKMIAFLCILFLCGLIYGNYKVEKSVIEKQKKLQLIEEKTKEKYAPVKKISYSDIAKALGNMEELKITKFTQNHENNTIAIEAYIMGDIFFSEKILRNINVKDQTPKISNIRIGRNKNGEVITKLNMNFINNK